MATTMPRGWSPRDTFTALIIFLLALAARASYWAVRTTRQAPDTNDYLNACDGWLVAVTGRAGSNAVGLEYAGFTLPLCGFLSIPGSSFDAWVAVQILLSAISVVLVFDAGRRLLGYRAGAVAGVAIAVLFQSFQWTIYVLSDAFFIVTVTVALWALVRYHQRPTVSNRFIALGSLGYMAFTRPFGIPMAGAWLVLDALPDRYREYRVNVLPRWVAVTGIVFGSVAGALTLGPLSAPGIIDFWAQGTIVWNDPTFQYQYDAAMRPTLIWFVVANSPHLLVMGMLKLLVFFFPFVPRYSTVHILINSVTVLPVVVFGLLGGWYALRRDSDVSHLLLPPLVGLLFAISLTFVDYDWRYRAPAGPLLALLAGYAITAIPVISDIVDWLLARLPTDRVPYIDTPNQS